MTLQEAVPFRDSSHGAWPPRLSAASVRPAEDFAHPVLQVLADRIRSGSMPQHRSDGARLALAVEGGGMRGVLPAGMLWALSHVDGMRCFDAVYATSAGAINSAYALAGQPDWGASVYFEDAPSGHLVDWSGVLSRRPILSLDFLLGEVAGGTKLMHHDALRRSGVPFHVVTTDAETGERHVLSDFADRATLLRALRASCSIPRVTGDPIRVGDRMLLDGTFSEAIPYKVAVEQGATHVLVLRSRPAGAAKAAPGRARSALTKLLMRGPYPRIGELATTRWRRYGEAVIELNRHSADPNLEPALLQIAVPATTKLPSQIASDREVLVPAFRAGAQRLLDELAPGIRLVETLQAFDTGE